jgi:hypothetical protein
MNYMIRRGEYARYEKYVERFIMIFPVTFTPKIISDIYET